MKNNKILYLFMSVWMLLATSASAALAVCHAPCCMPGAATVAASEAHDCCGTSSTEEEAAAFFSDGYVAPPASLAAAEGGECHLEQTDNCVAELHKGGEYVTHNLTIPLDAPGEAFTPASAAIDPHTGFRQTNLLRAASPPGDGAASIIVKISSFLC